MNDLRILKTAEEIRKRVAELGAQITADYPQNELCLVGILKGACFFLSDLARAIQRPVRIDFIGTSSYGVGKTTSGQVKLTKDLDTFVEGLDILLVEDIVDTGVTLTYLTHILEQRKPRSLEIATLLDKPARRLRPIRPRYVGFEIGDEFVVGYGLDFAEQYRNLPDICVLQEASEPPAPRSIDQP